jgi:hypothetical protein
VEVFVQLTGVVLIATLLGALSAVAGGMLTEAVKMLSDKARRQEVLSRTFRDNLRHMFL